jgi:hypothetical protein
MPRIPARVCRALLATAAILAAAAAPAQETPAADWSRKPAIANYQAYAEFKMANYAAARRVWEHLAGIGNAEALFNLGVLAEDGLGEPRDLPKAEALYVAAAEAGGFKAQYRLGMLYATGGLLARDPAKARRYLGAAAAAGDRDAAARLAGLELPDDAPRSPFESAERLAARGEYGAAAALYRQLAATGDAVARTRLAWMLEAGRGVDRDLAAAGRLFLTSAEAGDAEAQYAVGVMFKTGRGQPADPAQGSAWLRRAAAQGHPAARAALAGEGEPLP